MNHNHTDQFHHAHEDIPAASEESQLRKETRLIRLMSEEERCQLKLKLQKATENLMNEDLDWEEINRMVKKLKMGNKEPWKR